MLGPTRQTGTPREAPETGPGTSCSARALLTSTPGRALTQLVIPRVVRDLHGVDLETAGALSQAVRAGDSGALLVHYLHQLDAVGGTPNYTTHPPWRRPLMQRVPGAPTPLVCSVGTASMVGVAASDPSPSWVLAPEGDALWVPPSRGERGPTSLSQAVSGMGALNTSSPVSPEPSCRTGPHGPGTSALPGACPCSCGVGSPDCLWSPPRSGCSSCGRLQEAGRALSRPPASLASPPPAPAARQPPALTRHGTPQHFQAQAQAAVPGERVDADEAGHHRLRELAQHGRVLVHIPVEGLGRGRPQSSVAPAPAKSPLQPQCRGRAASSGAHHFLVAVGVHRPRLAVVAEAHEEGGHEVITGEQMAVRARLLPLPPPGHSGAARGVWGLPQAAGAAPTPSTCHGWLNAHPRGLGVACPAWDAVLGPEPSTPR